MDGDFVSLRKIGVNGWNVAADEKLDIEGCEAGVWERGGMSERNVFKREADEKGKERYDE